MRMMLTQSLHKVHRFIFTLSSLAGFSLVALLTGTHLGSISSLWLERLGFAPNDLQAGSVERLFTSAVVTQGGSAFWEAMGMTALSVGLAEWLGGTRRTLATFWGIHLATLLAGSWVLTGLFQLSKDTGVEELLQARDVGPSAGYFGCLGLACGRLPGRWRGFGLLIGTASLILAIFLPARNGESPTVKLAADLAHLIAFPLGWASVLIRSAKND